MTCYSRGKSAEQLTGLTCSRAALQGTKDSLFKYVRRGGSCKIAKDFDPLTRPNSLLSTIGFKMHDYDAKHTCQKLLADCDKAAWGRRG